MKALLLSLLNKAPEVSAYIMSHLGLIGTAGAIVWDLLRRYIKTAKPASLLMDLAAILGGLALGLGKIQGAIAASASAIDSFLPQNLKDEVAAEKDAVNQPPIPPASQ